MAFAIAISQPASDWREHNVWQRKQDRAEHQDISRVLGEQLRFTNAHNKPAKDIIVDAGQPLCPKQSLKAA